jgi:hypothetical protein
MMSRPMRMAPPDNFPGQRPYDSVRESAGAAIQAQFFLKSDQLYSLSHQLKISAAFLSPEGVITFISRCGETFAARCAAGRPAIFSDRCRGIITGTGGTSPILM